VSDRDEDRTGELPPSEPVGRTGTEPIRPPVVPATRRRTGGGTGIPGSLLVIGAVILVAGLLLGFLIGRATGPDEPSDDAAVEQTGGGDGGGGGQGGGGGGGDGQGQRRSQRRRACQEALSLSQQITAAQNQLLTNRGELIRAVVVEDAEQIEQLNAQSDQLIRQIQDLQQELERQTRRCL
jgi:uncharacterized protein HemX